MMYTIRVSDGVDKVIAKWKKSNPNLFKKYKKIYKELLEHPKTGLGTCPLGYFRGECRTARLPLPGCETGYLSRILILGAGKMGSFFTDILSFQHETAVFDVNPHQLRFVYNTYRFTPL